MALKVAFMTSTSRFTAHPRNYTQQWYIASTIDEGGMYRCTLSATTDEGGNPSAFVVDDNILWKLAIDTYGR